MSVLLLNKDAHRNYTVIETIEAGIKLQGFETKSLRKKNGSLKGSYVVIQNEKPYLKGLFIPPYQPGNTPSDYDPYRLRELLLTKKELREIAHEKKADRITLIPISIGVSKRRIVVSVGLAKGKKKQDKRQDIKRRDMERDLKRKLK